MPEVLADWEMYKDPADRVILDEWEEGMASHPEALEADLAVFEGGRAFGQAAPVTATPSPVG